MVYHIYMMVSGTFQVYVEGFPVGLVWYEHMNISKWLDMHQPPIHTKLRGNTGQATCLLYKIFVSIPPPSHDWCRCSMFGSLTSLLISEDQRMSAAAWYLHHSGLQRFNKRQSHRGWFQDKVITLFCRRENKRSRNVRQGTCCLSLCIFFRPCWCHI